MHDIVKRAIAAIYLYDMMPIRHNVLRVLEWLEVRYGMSVLWKR